MLSLVISLALILTGVVAVAISIPLLKGRIKPNPHYGFRTKLTLSSEQVWYPSNRFGAKAFILWGVGMVLVGAFSFALHPLSGLWELVFALIYLTVLIPYLVTFRWCQKRFGGFAHTEQSTP